MKVTTLFAIVGVTGRSYTAVHAWGKKADFPGCIGIGGQTNRARLYPIEDTARWLEDNGKATADQIDELRELASEVQS